MPQTIKSSNRASVDSSRTLVDSSANMMSTSKKEYKTAADSKLESGQRDAKPAATDANGKQYHLSDGASKIPVNLKLC
ncbi:hypothetical protein K4F52_000008 [Lecanicillium sp. MT-2017a]|nr:hypothetical protein K4F52_000008 [Lecanicillium sp. MT-2017a]